MLIAVLAGFCTGVVSQLAWPVLPSDACLLVAVVVSAIAAWCMRKPPYFRLRMLACTALGIACGMWLAAMHACAVLDARVPAGLEGQNFQIDARVVATTIRADGSVALDVVVDRLPWDTGAWLPMPGWQMRLGSRFPVAALPGERWQFVARLQRPHGSINPGGMDFERYLLGSRVVATGYLRESVDMQRLSPATGWQAWRATLIAAALPLLGDGAGDVAQTDAERFARAVIPALVLDDRSLLSAAQWRVLGTTGTAHLVAISGLHVALLWGALLWTGARLLRRKPDALRYRALAVLPATAIATAYAELAGMPLPAARATLMLAVASGFIVAGGQVPVWRVLLMATAVVLAFDPLSAHASGFWLSYGAVALLVLLNDLHWRPLKKQTPVWIAATSLGVRMQASLALLMMPMLVAIFGAASLSSTLANIPAIPVFNLVALPFSLIGFLLAPIFPGTADACFDLVTTVLGWLWEFLARVDAQPVLAPLQLQGAHVWQLIALCVLLPMALFAYGAPMRIALVCMVLLAWPVGETLRHGEARVCVLDVGQGLSVVARTSRHALVYDAGPSSGERDAGIASVVPSARAMGIHELDMLVVSHEDPDHAGGAASVAQALAPLQIVVGDAATRRRLDGKGTLCDTRVDWRWDGIDFVLLPGAVSANRNDRACVLRLGAGRHALLVDADSSEKRELQLGEQFGDVLAADVLVAGNHGSRHSSPLTFLYHVMPKQVVVAAGYRNRFGYPHPDALARARRLGATVRETARDGAVCMRLAADATPQPYGMRSATRRFWRD